MLLVALHIIFKEKKARGEDYFPLGYFILRIGKIINGRLFLSDEEFILTRDALNVLRDSCISDDRYTDGFDI